MNDSVDAIAHFLVERYIPALRAQAAQDIRAYARRNEVVVFCRGRGGVRIAAALGGAFAGGVVVWRHHVDALDDDGAGADVV